MAKKMSNVTFWPDATRGSNSLFDGPSPTALTCSFVFALLYRCDSYNSELKLQNRLAVLMTRKNEPVFFCSSRCPLRPAPPTRRAVARFRLFLSSQKNKPPVECADRCVIWSSTMRVRQSVTGRGNIRTHHSSKPTYPDREQEFICWCFCKGPPLLLDNDTFSTPITLFGR